MKPSILLLAISVAALSSCTTAYKTGQTPDDVYYSPAPPQEEYATVNRNDDNRYQSQDDYYDDRYLHMKVQDRYQWSYLDDWYSYDRYSYSYFSNYYYNPWTPNYYWNCYYNPYYNHGVIYNTGHPAYTYNRPRMYNLNTYNNYQLTNHTYNTPAKYNPGRGNAGNYSNSYQPYTPSRNNNNRNNNSNTGSFLRNVFNSGNNGNSSSNNSSNNSGGRTSSSSSSSPAPSSAPVRKF